MEASIQFNPENENTEPSILNYTAPAKVEAFDSQPLSRQEQLDRDYFYAARSYAVYWAQAKFKWQPRKYQILLLGCLDRVYRHPLTHPNKELRGKPVSRFAWRIGRQSGKSECLALAALYLSLMKPIKTERKWVAHRKDAITDANPTGRIEGSNVEYRGAEIIMASADADKAKTVFERVLKFIDMSDEYKLACDNDIIQIKKHPFPSIEFHIAGWTSPARVVFRGPGAGGQAARSKTFDYKLYDEADYMPEAFFAAELATEINAASNALTIISSTPSGKRANFYKACFGFEAMVTMYDGSLKQIKDVTVGHRVLNRYGQPARVTDAMERPYEGDMYRMKLGGPFGHIRVTPYHRIMSLQVRNRFCDACQKVVWTNSKCVLYGKHKYAPPEPVYNDARKLVAGDYVAIPRTVADQHYDFWNGDHGKFVRFPDNTKAFWDDQFVYVVIKNNDLLEKQKSIVYNLSVEGDQSYTVNGMGVSNCTDITLGYKEFWFPSWENPKYDIAMDRRMTKELTNTQYEHEIMADWGTVEQGVFNWNYFQQVFSYKYKQNQKAGAFEYRYIGLTKDDITHIGMKNIGGWLTRRFIPRNNLAKYWFGADLGYSADPSEFMVFEEFNGVMKLIMRIHLEHVTYDFQADLIALLDTHYMFNMLGMDAGNSGQAVAQILQSRNTGWNKFAQHRFDKRLLPIAFGGVLVIDRINGQDIKEPSKIAMTNMIIYHGEQRLLVLPGTDYDPDIENQFRNHTYNIGTGGQIVYSKGSIYPDHCLVPGTIVTTARGDVAIENVQVGDYALTRKGYRKVTFSGKTFDNADTFDVELSDGRIISGTGNHPIFVKNKDAFVRVDELMVGDQLFDINELEKDEWTNKLNTVKQSLPSSMELNIDDIQKLCMRQVEAIFEEKTNCSTASSGHTTTDQFPPVVKSIIGTEILTTMLLKTWNAYRAKNTTPGTLLQNLRAVRVRSSWNFWTKYDRSRKNGMAQKLVSIGTVSTQRRASLLNRSVISSVRIAPSNFNRNKPQVVSAPLNARTTGTLLLTPTTANTSPALGVTSNSSIKATKRNKEQAPVPIHVVRISAGKKSEVYDLTVEDAHEFFAHGVLTANCIDAIRTAFYAKTYANMAPRRKLPTGSTARARNW